MSKCDTDQTIWKVAVEHGNKGLLEKVLECGKNYKLIRNIERFCISKAAFVTFSTLIMPYVTA